MTAIKRCCALALAVLMILTALPVTAFAQAAEQEVNASLQETTVSGIANDIARQVLRSGQKNGEKIQMENTAKLDDSDEVEIIVVVNDSVADPDSRAQVNALLRTQKSALAQINRAIDARVEPQRQYTTLLNGFSATVTYGQYKAIRKLDCVQSAFISPTFELLPDTANSNRMIGGGIYNTTGFTGEGMLVAILDTGVDMSHEIFKTAPKSPSLTQEKLRTLLETYDFQVESIIKGISVSNLYYSAKIPFQFDYGDKDKDGNPGEKGSHGTHVASTAAGNVGVNDAVMGVAPQAQIINMNVFKSTGGASYADILAALEDCILLGVDVANLSLGSDCGYIDYDSEDAFTKSLLDVFERTGESGVSLAVAAGNAYNAAYGDAFGGKALASNPDYGLVSEPSTYGESLSVAAVSNGMVKGPYVTVGGKNLAYQDSATISEDENAKPFRSLSARGSIEYVVVPNYGAEEDYAGLDLTGKIALVQRGGGMYYEQKERNAANAGAIGMLVYNNVPGMLYMSITDWKIPCAFISQAAGEYMKQQETKTLSVASADALVKSPTYGMADFSSWGATPELTLKPEITAPGAGIYAAVPGGYESMDGTSMASPHAAGGMAIVQQALKARDNSMTGAQRKHMTDTLLMSTAHVIYDDNGVPYSPRKQGAGLMSINDAVNTRGYLSVEGMERPKLELKDDPAMKGVYTMTFTVHNTGSDTLYYDVTPLVLTDTTEAYVNGNQQEFSTISGSSRLLPHTFTTNCENNRVAVAPGKTADVTVTVTVTGEGRKMLAQFPNGSYVEGFVTLTQVAADGSALTDPIDLGLPFLAFYGDWTKAPIMDSTDYWETLDGSASQAQAYMNTAFSSSSENTVDTYLGDNNYTTVPYLADRNAISPNNDDFMDSLTGIYTGLLRNTKSLKYTITGANGQVYYSKDCEYVGKSIYSYDYYRIVPAGVDAEYDGIEPWYGTDSHNAKLPNNTKATVTIEATLPYGDGVGTNQKHSWSFPITIDTEEPHADNLKVTESEGRYYLSLDVSDNQYVAAVVFYNIKNSEMLYGMQGFGEDKPGVTSHIKEYDITGFGETFGMIVHDYAGNSKVYTVRAPGNPDDHGTITPTNILWTENFNEKWLPDDWSVQSKGGSLNTWYRDEDYMAAVDHDDDNQQDEWLISRTTDISGVDTEVHMVFDFYTTYWHTVEYKHCNLQVMASGDGGQNWQEIWNLQRDSGLFTAWTKTQAKVTIPESLQNSKDLRFAFVYTGKGGSNLSLDNVQLYAEERDNYVAVTATAGESGTITPAGQTLVKKGTSKTFDIAPAQGYEIVNVNVDGTDLGPISYYTFQRVGVDHTISATFQKAQPSGDVVLFDNDFESVTGESFPFHGWSLKGVNTNGYTWKQQTYWNWKDVNDTKHAYISDDWNGGAQDEYLISPAVNLTGKEATLSFDYGYGYYGAQNKTYTATVEVSTDGGQTWTALWNFFDSYNGEKSGVVSGRKELAIPAQYAVDGVQFAFHYVNPTHETGPLAVDNVKLTAPGGSSDTVTLTTTANEGGTVAPAGQTSYAPGASVKVTFTPDPGYQLASVKVNGRTVDVTDGAYTLVMDQSYAVSAAFEKIPDVPVVMFQNDFEDVAGDRFPFHGWTLKGVNPNGYTWKQYTYYNWKSLGNDTKHAYISDDWHGGPQDEWLISPSVNLSGTRDGVLYFDYAYGVYGIKNKTFTATVEASTDGGQTWTPIWNFQDSYTGQETSDYALAGSAEVKVPAQYAVDGVQFAFRYVNTTHDTAPLAVDNVKLMAVEDGPVARKYTITATAGEGGSITPAGEVSVKEGASQTFAIAAQEGYAIADVLVDGQSVGAVDSYTFENVTANHTIAALFTKTASDVQFDNDFESESFPGHGWTVKGTRTDSPYTWYKGTNTKLNSTKQARIDMDYYEDPLGGGWSVGGIRKPLLPMAGGSDKLQDEYLISPVVNLTGKTPTLNFDYLLFKYVIGRYCSVTVEATTDGGRTWTTIWNAADLGEISGYWYNGTAHVAVPAAFCTDNAQLAFHFYKKANAGYDDDDAMFAIDNVTMTYGATDPCADGHTLTAVAEVPATCEETGVKAHWVCSVCGKLFSDAEGKNETTLEALTIGALGHDYGEAAWTWTGYESAKATFTCSHDASHVEEVTAAVTSEITTPASCESTGVRTYTATVTFQGKNYTDTRTEVLPALGHAWGEPVWTWTGYGAAEASFACARDAGHVKVLPASITSEVTTQPGCSTEGVRTYTATVTLEGKNYTDTRTETLPSLGHKTQLVGAKPATCTEDGYTGDEVCTVCQEIVRKGEVIPALGHKTQLVGAKPATCTEDGYTGDEVCTICQEVVKKGEVIPALGHKTQLVGAKAATCTEDGYTGDEVCTVCQEIVKKGEVIPALGHKTQLVGAKAATCTEDGYTGDEVCTVCGETVKKGEVIPALGHKTQLVGAKAATCTEDGYTGDEVCTVCGETVKKGEVIPATGHDYKDGKCTNCGGTDPNYKPEQPGVKTGDESHLALYLAAASVSLLAAALWLGKKKHLN
ncbi:MAG: S8 family serine peptidase [Oscillibacter sp.]|nr:S8 family serine peptidase [Oscillibacter sp.]